MGLVDGKLLLKNPRLPKLASVEVVASPILVYCILAFRNTFKST
jgi:hypothetical protein